VKVVEPGVALQMFQDVSTSWDEVGERERASWVNLFLAVIAGSMLAHNPHIAECRVDDGSYELDIGSIVDALGRLPHDVLADLTASVMFHWLLALGEGIRPDEDDRLAAVATRLMGGYERAAERLGLVVES